MKEKFVFVLNLKPKKLFGVESRGMLIVAESEEGKVYLLPVPDEVLIGTKVWWRLFEILLSPYRYINWVPCPGIVLLVEGTPN